MAKKDERRKHERYDVPCPITISGEGGLVVTGKTWNVSDGGIFLPGPLQTLPACGAEIEVRFSVPRSTPNSYMLEEFHTPARVLRHQPAGKSKDDNIGVAMVFLKPLDLKIEV